MLPRTLNTKNNQMKLLTTLFFVVCYTLSIAQTPFATYTKPKLISKEEYTTREGKAPDDKTLYCENLKKIDSLSMADYFDHMNANIVVIQDARKFFPTLNGEIVNYRFGIWTEKKVTKEGTGNTKEERMAASDVETEPRVHYLPFSIITKISSNYLDSSAGPINDATSFFGAPLTFRLSPAFDLLPNNTENKLFMGANADLRLLAFGNDAENTIDVGWGAYISGGITYMGRGHAYTINEENKEETRYEGKWSFSAILYWFKSGGKFNKAIFDNFEKKSLSGIEMMLKFKASKKEDSKFNVLVSASNGFTKGASNFAKWEFRIGVGK